MSDPFYTALIESNTPLEFVSKLAQDPNLVRKSYDVLQGTPVKPYPSQGDKITLSRAIYPTLDNAAPEVDRTALGHYHLFMYLKNDPSGFPKLSKEAFQKAQELIFDAIKREGRIWEPNKGIQIDDIDPEKLAVLITFLAIHDLPKIVEFTEKAKQLAEDLGVYLDTTEHDNVNFGVLFSGNEAFIAQLYPDFARLNPTQRHMLLSCIGINIYDEKTRAKLAVQSNAGRSYQLESTPGAFYPVAIASDRLKTQTYAFSEAMNAAAHFIDIGSTQGDKFAVPGLGAVTKSEGVPVNFANGFFWLNDSMALGFGLVRKIEAQVLSGQLTPKQAYDEIVKCRAKEFGLFNFNTDSAAYVATRISAHISTRFVDGHLTTPEEAEKILVLFKNNEGEENNWKRELEAELCRSGFDGQPALFVGYAPDMAKIIFAGFEKDSAYASLTADEKFDRKIEIYLRSMYNLLMPLKEQLAMYGSDAKEIGVELQNWLKPLQEDYKLFYHGLVPVEFNPQTRVYAVSPAFLAQKKEAAPFFSYAQQQTMFPSAPPVAVESTQEAVGCLPKK